MDSKCALGLLVLTLSRHVSHVSFRHECNPTSCWFKVNLGSSYIEYNNFCIKGKIITLAVITRAYYFKKLSCGTNTYTFG